MTPKLWIFADWDETITSHDTLSLIAPPDSSEPNAPPPFSYFAQYYLKVIADYEQSFGPRDTLEQQLAYLESLGPVERVSVRKVEEKGLFKGVKEDDIKERAQRVEFREGWKDFTEEAMKREDVRLMGILSVNWSSAFIDSALRRIHDDAFMHKFEIRANELEMDSEGKGTGKLSKEGKMGICTGHDKLREMKTVLKKKSSSESVVTVYVGDSNTDLPCLLHADIGIIIGEGKSVIETCNRVGIKVNRELSLRAIKPKEEKAEPILYHYDDWTAIVNSSLFD